MYHVRTLITIDTANGRREIDLARYLEEEETAGFDLAQVIPLADM